MYIDSQTGDSIRFLIGDTIDNFIRNTSEVQKYELFDSIKNSRGDIIIIIVMQTIL